MTGPSVRPPTPQEEELAALGAELAPARSLSRLDAATARAVAIVTIVGALLAGGAVLGSAGSSVTGWAQALLVAAVIFSTVAGVTALAAQTLTVTSGINTGNLSEVSRWYHRKVQIRSALARSATVLLLLGAAAAGAAGTVILASANQDSALDTSPTVSVSQVIDPAGPNDEFTIDLDGSQRPVVTRSVTVEVTFRGMAAGQVATASLTADSRTLAQTAFTADTDASGSRSLTAGHVADNTTVTFEATTVGWACTGKVAPRTTRPVLACRRVAQ